ncbi:MAG: pseudouridine synthase [Chitinophagia bacterium]|nr:pseudouridine synthase [Chitinophagia bacterium]
MEHHRYFILNKPFNMVSQFVCVEPVRTLSDIDFEFPPNTHVIGRLDSLSEGLLLLTTDKTVMRRLFQSGKPHLRTYLVRVLGDIDEDKLEQLRTGVRIRVRGKGDYTTLPCEVTKLAGPPDVLPYQLELNPYIIHSWLSVSLYEGKHHQIRNMMNAVHHPCRRLIRMSIEHLELGDLPPGNVLELAADEFFKLLELNGD